MTFMIVVLVFIDQIIKMLVKSFITDPIVIISNFLQLEYVKNFGVSFGFASGSTNLIVLLNLIIVGVFLYLYFKPCLRYQKIAYGLIIAGGIGNLIDRVLYSYVIDYISLYKIGFPVFNLADVLLNVGCLLLIIELIREKR